jgi:hypothetical protein
MNARAVGLFIIAPDAAAQWTVTRTRARAFRPSASVTSSR